LKEASELIIKQNPLFVSPEIINPRYEEIQITGNISLRKEYNDIQYYKNQLIKDLKVLLAPWTSSGSVAPEYGTILYKSQIINYIEELEYIDHVFSITVIKSNIDGSSENCDGKISPSKESVIITSSDTHNITVVSS
jgi:hypothetical protein